MRTLTILILLSLPIVAFGQSTFRVDTSFSFSGKQPKNDTIDYAIEILLTGRNISTEWHRVLAVRHYEFLPFDCGMNYCHKWQPILDYYIFPISKHKVVNVKILRSVEL